MKYHKVMGYWTWHYSLTFDVEGTRVEIFPTFVIGVYTRHWNKACLIPHVAVYYYRVNIGQLRENLIKMIKDITMYM